MRYHISLKRLFASLLMLGAIIMVGPRAWGFATGLVGFNQSGTLYPAANTSVTPVISCAQTGPTLTLEEATTYNNSYFRCTNNWSRTLTISISVLDGAGTGLSLSGYAGTVPAGGTACIPGGSLSASNGGGPSSTVLYQATGQETYLLSRVSFTGTVDVKKKSNTTPTPCT